MNPILGVVLAAQLILAVVLAATGGDTAAATRGPLLALGDASVDTIVIAAGDDDALKLVKQEGGWQVPAKSGFPADKQQVHDLLDSLKNLHAWLPIATSTAARERFRVGQDRFARRITLKDSGDTVATVYFGESAGPGEVYARVAQADAIYEVRFELWSASADAGRWLDSSYLHRATAELARVELPGMTLEFEGNAWQLTQLPDGKTTAVNKTAAMVSDLTTLAFEAMVGVKQAMDLPEPAFAYTLVTESGERVSYRFRKRSAPDAGSGTPQQGTAGNDTPTWLLTTSKSQYVFRISGNEVARLRDASRSKLVMAADGPDKPDDAEASTMAETADAGQAGDNA